MSLIEQHTSFIKSFSKKLGVDYCGIAKAKRLDADAARLENWLNKDMHGSMKYMENHFELRVNPCKL
ncbi:MAG: tRNA epoxyqueuosine(34) reductase QueG, partial [Bacteroidota bacterium]|nr:tRNA epoxyqueuosine(34) reductase QueG [Bacteroidota bacterium]